MWEISSKWNSFEKREGGKMKIGEDFFKYKKEIMERANLIHGFKKYNLKEDNPLFDIILMKLFELEKARELRIEEISKIELKEDELLLIKTYEHFSDEIIDFIKNTPQFKKIKSQIVVSTDEVEFTKIKKQKKIIKRWECVDCNLGETQGPCISAYDENTNPPDHCVSEQVGKECNWKLVSFEV
jgi:hypothetical protein